MRIGNTATAATVNYATSDGTASAASDYAAATGTINFAAGETVKTFLITVNDDLFAEGKETINLALLNPSTGNFLGSPNTATLTIFDNDVQVQSPPEVRNDSSGPGLNQAAALEALLFTRDPFPLHTLPNWLNNGPDKNTRAMIFASNLFLDPGEVSSVVVVNLVDANNQTFDVAAEDVRAVRDTELAQVTFRLPDTIVSGQCTVRLKVHNLTSNPATFAVVP
jgi:hypothetical protein